MPITDAQRRKLSLDLQRIAKVIEKELQRSTGQRMAFSLVIWGTFGGDDMTQYVANTPREDALLHMLNLCKSWVAGMPDVPFHERQ